MFRKSTTLITLAATALAFAATSESPKSARAAAPVVVESYWRCPSSFAFETSGTAVHCKKPAWTETKPFIACLPPTPDLKMDLVGTTDMCSGGIGIAVTAEPQCNPVDVANGFSKRHVGGRDYCAKFHEAEVIPPNQQISL
jgi:hypothetical protein